MISSASLLAVVAGMAGADSLPAALVERVRELIGVQWAVPAGTVQLEWGRYPVLDSTAATASLRLGGTGRNGWFVVTIEPTGGRAAAVAVRAGTLQAQPVAARSIAPGARLRAADIAVAEQVTWGPPAGSVSGSPAVSEGWEVRRAIKAGELLTAPSVQPPKLVQSGDPVVFEWRRGSIAMERVAIAQGSARLGERVQAQVGQIRLTGIVVGPRRALIEREVAP